MGFNLTATGITQVKSGHRVLKNVNIQIGQNELVGVIGPNGAGKSSLLKVLSGFEAPLNGDIQLNNQSLRSFSALQRAQHISFLAQYSQSSFAFGVFETIALGARPNTQSQDSIKTQIQKMADQLNIRPLLTKRMNELSGGEAQLVHFARIQLQDAPLMLLDEPTASLDVGHESHLLSILKQQCKNGYSALMAIHNINVAAAFCDRLILLNQGAVHSHGSVEQVITPQTIRELYGQHVRVLHDEHGTPFILPNARQNEN